MSWEAFGSGPEPFDIDKLYEWGWQSDEDCERWWTKDDVEKIYTLDQAIQAYEDLMYDFED